MHLFLKNGMLFILICLFSFSTLRTAVADDSVCANTKLITGSQALDLSDAFTQSRSATFSMTTNWAGSVGCPTAKQYFYYQQPFATPVYLHFTDSNSDSQWIKLLVTRSPAKVSLNGQKTPFNVNLYPAKLTIIAELATAPADGSDIISSTTGEITLAVSTMTSNSATSDLDAREAILTPAWFSLFWAARQNVTFTFKPKATTCNATDKTVSLSRVTLSQVLSRSESTRTPFTLNLTCHSGIVDTALNPVKVWLSSNDIVNNDNTILRNSASTSSGIGISLQDSNQNPVIFADSNGSAGSTLLSIKRGDALSEYSLQIPLAAYYSVFDLKNVSAGDIYATSTVMFSWD